MPDQPTTRTRVESTAPPSSGRQPLIALATVIVLAYVWGAGLALLPL